MKDRCVLIFLAENFSNFPQLNAKPRKDKERIIAKS